MFGSDQIIWPYTIEKSIRFLHSLTFLTTKDKEDKIYNNAVKFLRLKNNSLTGCGSGRKPISNH